MTNIEVIERLCTLVTTVGEEIFKDEIPHDCFCESNEHRDTSVIDERIIQFIEDVVNKAVNR